MLNDPDIVRREYATESRFLVRRAAFANASGPSALDAVFDAVAEARPRRYLEVGCGPGEMAARVASELGADVVALDLTLERDAVRDYVAASIAHAHLADRLPAFDEALAVTRHMTIFIATT